MAVAASAKQTDETEVLHHCIDLIEVHSESESLRYARLRQSAVPVHVQCPSLYCIYVVISLFDGFPRPHDTRG